MNIQIRSANLSDEALLLRWVNDSAVRLQSFHQGMITPGAHSKWFRERLADSDCMILIGENELGLPIGQVRFDINLKLHEAVIDISIDSAIRGAGISSILLNQSMKTCASLLKNITFIAEVREENRPSQRLFNRLQFKKIESRRPGTITFQRVFE